MCTFYQLALALKGYCCKFCLHFKQAQSAERYEVKYFGFDQALLWELCIIQGLLDLVQTIASSVSLSL